MPQVRNVTFTCRCGAKFKLLRQLIEHIAIHNPRWPRRSDDDEHGPTVEEPRQ